MLTDGVNNSGQIDPLTAAEAARALGIKVYTIGAAQPGLVPVPVDTMFGTDIVYQESVLDEATLQQVADLTGAKYYRARDTQGLQAIYDEINELEKVPGRGAGLQPVSRNGRLAIGARLSCCCWRNWSCAPPSSGRPPNDGDTRCNSLIRKCLIIAAIVVPAAALLIYWAQRKQRDALSRLGNSALLQRLTDSVNWSGRRWQAVLRVAALSLLFVALARPQWGSETTEVDQEGLQVIVALDVSQSMLADDLNPNRLERAKLEIADLMKRLEGDEIGLVLFSGASFVQVPLTTDYSTALSYLDSAGPESISRPGTVIGDAIRTATEAFDDKLASQKVLILMTDGEDVETDPLAAARDAAEAGVLIYTIGFGTPEGSPVPETNPFGQVVGTKTDAQGNPVISRMNETTLQEIAAAGDGRYYRAQADGGELDSLLREIDTLQRAQLQSRVTVRYIERFQIFLGLALAGDGAERADSRPGDAPRHAGCAGAGGNGRSGGELDRGERRL